MTLWRRLGLSVVTIVAALLACGLDLFFFLGMKYEQAARFGGFVLPRAAGAGIIVACAVGLALARRRSLIVFAAVWLVGWFAAGFEQWLFFGCMAVALYWVAVGHGRRIAVGALLLSLLPLGTQAYVTRTDAADLVSAPATLAFMMLAVLPAWIWGRYQRAAVRKQQLLAEQQEQEAIEAIRDERHRLARELHDIVSHTVSVMTLQAAGARTLVGQDDERVVGSLDVIEQAGVQAMNELHRMLGILRSPDAGDDPGIQPQLRDLPGLIDLAKSAGQDVELRLDGAAGELDPSVELACFRVVQEALTNARKYAGAGAQVRIDLTWVPPELVVTVANDAGTEAPDPSMAAISGGHGLRGLTERVQLVGGELESGPTTDGGFRVRATLPVASIRRPAGQDHRRMADPPAWQTFD